MYRTLIVIVVGLIIGAGVGVAVGWGFPISVPKTSPSALSADWQFDWVLMTAQAYHLDGDLTTAKQRLAVLGKDDPGARVARCGEQALDQGLPPSYIGALARLAAALGARNSKLEPYLAK